MTIGELKLIIEEYDEELEVRFAAQPSWPMEYSLRSQAYAATADALYLVEHEQEGYLPSDVQAQLGW